MAIIKILIQDLAVNHSIFSNTIGSKSNGIFHNFVIFLIKSTIDPALCIKSCLMYGQKKNFLIFLIQFGSLAIKVIAFWEISPLAPLHTQNGALCLVKCEISIISPIGLVHWLSKLWHLVKFH